MKGISDEDETSTILELEDVIEELRDEREGRINDMIRGYNDGRAMAEALKGE